MKRIFLLVILFTIGTLISSYAQTTIVLLRHAEKEAATGTMSATDPELSEAGKQRAQQLLTQLKDHNFDLFYSTNYIRTKNTIAPLASKFSKSIEIYDPRKMQDFAAELKKLQGKTVVVAGHSNTTPMLVNALLGENKYQPLDESVYNTYWVVTIDKDGKVTDKMIVW